MERLFEASGTLAVDDLDAIRVPPQRVVDLRDDAREGFFDAKPVEIHAASRYRIIGDRGPRLPARPPRRLFLGAFRTNHQIFLAAQQRDTVHQHPIAAVAVGLDDHPLFVPQGAHRDAGADRQRHGAIIVPCVAGPSQSSRRSTRPVEFFDMGSLQSVAVVQAAPVAFDIARTLQKVGDLAADAGRRGARLTLFPEAFVSAYPRGLDFGAAVGSRSPEGREQFRIYWDSAIDVPGPHVDQLAAVARANQTHLVVGVVERDGGTLYCTVLFFGPDGRYLGKHRKVMPTGSERLICWENYMPLLRAGMYAKGIEIYCAPTAGGRETWLPTMQHVAQEGRCFVLSSNQFARRRDYPADYATPFSDDRDDIARLPVAFGNAAASVVRASDLGTEQ